MCAFCYAMVSPVGTGAQQPSGTSAPPSANVDRTVWAGVYNAAQAKRGEAVSVTSCVICHGDELLGNEAPGLVGPDFLAGWTTQTVGDLFDRVKKTMPQDHPGKLTDQENADVVAYILSLNTFPAGDKELSTDASVLKQIRITAKTDAK
jgi:mono/diheme cytochrome c family protein